VADEEVRDVGNPASPEDALVLAEREQPLHRHEHRREHEQGENEPVEAEVVAALAHFPEGRMGASEQDGQERRRHPRDRQNSPPPQERAHEAQQEGQADHQLQNGADHGQRIVAAEVRRHQDPRIAKAEHREDRQDAEEDGKRPADPARPEMGRLVVVERPRDPVFERHLSLQSEPTTCAWVRETLPPWRGRGQGAE
jgi:hypothetical protein